MDKLSTHMGRSATQGLYDKLSLTGPPAASDPEGILTFKTYSIPCLSSSKPAGASKRFISGLCLVGFINWLIAFDRNAWDKPQLVAVFAAAAFVFIPTLRQLVDRLIASGNQILSPRRWKAAAGVTLVSTAYLVWFAYLGRDNLFVRIHDEHSYLLQARMLAHFRLWLPSYPPAVAPFFDGFSLIVDRVWASMYFPGTALLMVPSIWLHLPFWITPLLESSFAAGLLYLLVEELFTPVEALLAVVMLLGVKIFRDSSVELLSESPFLLAEMALLLAWFRFRQLPRVSLAICIGVASGFAAITRPLDAACFALPIGITLCVQIRREKLRCLAMVFAIVFGAAPMLALQAIQNKGVTGNWLTFPESYYNRENFPASPLGFHDLKFDRIPQPANPAKRTELNQWLIPQYRDHTPLNALKIFYPTTLRNLIFEGLPDLFFVIPLLVGLGALADPRLRAMTLCATVFVIAYAFYLFAIAHYVISIIPTLVCLVLLGCATLSQLLSYSKVARLPYLLVAAFSLASVGQGALPPEVDTSIAHDQRPANALLPLLPHQPAVVLFHYNTDHSQFHDDPVYNDEVEFPDQADIIRAWDLGPELNPVLFDYYARREPNRVFYLYDPLLRFQKKYPITQLGTAGDLAKRYPLQASPVSDAAP